MQSYFICRIGLPVNVEKLGLTGNVRGKIEAAIASEAIGSNVLRIKPIKDYLESHGDEDISYSHIR